MKYDLEKRLIRFAVSILAIEEKLSKKTNGSMVLARQIAKSSTSPALNYGEAQSAESRKDFIHKMRICQKELRETHICLQIISAKKYANEEEINIALNECNQLLSIFSSSIKTASTK